MGNKTSKNNKNFQRKMPDKKVNSYKTEDRYEFIEPTITGLYKSINEYNESIKVINENINTLKAKRTQLYNKIDSGKNYLEKLENIIKAEEEEDIENLKILLKKDNVLIQEKIKTISELQDENIIINKKFKYEIGFLNSKKETTNKNNTIQKILSVLIGKTNEEYKSYKFQLDSLNINLQNKHSYEEIMIINQQLKIKFERIKAIAILINNDNLSMKNFSVGLTNHNVKCLEEIKTKINSQIELLKNNETKNKELNTCLENVTYIDQKNKSLKLVDDNVEDFYSSFLKLEEQIIRVENDFSKNKFAYWEQKSYKQIEMQEAENRNNSVLVASTSNDNNADFVPMANVPSMT